VLAVTRVSGRGRDPLKDLLLIREHLLNDKDVLFYLTLVTSCRYLLSLMKRWLGYSAQPLPSHSGKEAL